MGGERLRGRDQDALPTLGSNVREEWVGKSAIVGAYFNEEQGLAAWSLLRDGVCALD